MEPMDKRFGTKAEIDQRIAEIVRTAAEKNRVKARLDELVRDRKSKPKLSLFLAVVSGSKNHKVVIEQIREAQREVYRLRGRMDELAELVPSDRRHEVDDLWGDGHVPV